MSLLYTYIYIRIRFNSWRINYCCKHHLQLYECIEILGIWSWSLWSVNCFKHLRWHLLMCFWNGGVWGNDFCFITAGGSGVCMMSTTWRDEQHLSFINFISSFLSANSFRLNFVHYVHSTWLLVFYVKLGLHSIGWFCLKDFIFNCGGLSVAFIFVTNLNFKSISPMFSR